MDRRRFVLSWGRKIFFGLGWPLFCILALLFFKSDVFPKDALSIFYYVVTSLGFFGVLTTVLYFIFYVPLALIFPTYYFVRLWSSFLILIFSAAILLDAQVFGEYRFHINKVILNVFSDSPGKIFNDSLGPYYLTLGAVIFLFVVFWIRGEILWRVMQRRFSNPVKSWYLIFILLCMGASHLTWRYQVRTSFYGNGACARCRPRPGRTP